jgi:predicted  nucleic acid-binding Zn-ribbon protein
MNPLIEQLLVVQDRDQRIKAHRLQERNVPTERSALEAKREAAKGAFEALRDQAKHNEVERRKLEVEAQAKRDAIGRYRSQQTQTRKNEEYQALLHEIQRAEEEIRVIEDRELDLMEEAEKLATEVKGGEAELKRTNDSIVQQLKDLDEKSANLTKRLAELVTERATLAGTIDPEMLSLYDRILKSKGDVAIVPLEHEICQGCHMKTPGTTVSAVRADEGLVQDPNCGRILYRVI